ncbi:hypothetical protein ACIRON_03025 [Nocardioides sp. NPDC101246]|uniref:hypothetical protein n=1 Tax=Nocardioides sp. NPDC101246 TaxID=3364336 RepID=UPI003817967A
MFESTSTIPLRGAPEPITDAHPPIYASVLREFVSAGDTSWGGGSKPPARDSRGRFLPKAGAR